MTMLPDPKRDTACFSDRQWFVLDFAFTSEADANAAIKLAHFYSMQEKERLADEIRDKLNEVLS
jgi:hypothetical protein